SIDVVSIRAARLRLDAGARIRGHLAEHGPETTVESGKVCLGLTIRRHRFRDHLLRLDANRRRARFTALADCGLSLSDVRRVVLEPGRFEHRHETSTSAHGRFDDGRVVSIDFDRQLYRWT